MYFIILAQGATGRWRNQHCLEPFHFICAKNKGGTTIVTQQPTVRPGGCPAGYKMYESKCFKFVDELVNWSTAEARCQAQGAQFHLASISNVWEQCEYWVFN